MGFIRYAHMCLHTGFTYTNILFFQWRQSRSNDVLIAWAHLTSISCLPIPFSKKKKIKSPLGNSRSRIGAGNVENKPGKYYSVRKQGNVQK